MTTETERQPITARQQDVLDWIDGYINTHGFSPTLQEIQHAYGWRTKNAVMCHLRPLRRKGYIDWLDGKSRTIRVVGGDA